MSEVIYTLENGERFSVIAKPIEVKIIKYMPVLVTQDGREKNLIVGKPFDIEMMADILGMVEVESALREKGISFTSKAK